MFKIRDNAITPQKALFENALKRLPRAHQIAQAEGISHIHGQVVQAAEDAGQDPDPIEIGNQKGTLFVGISQSEAGDRLADSEFGLPETAPNPVLRTAAQAAHPEATRRYGVALRREVGI